MTPTDIEERIAKLERGVSLLKVENAAHRWFTTALIGSHPDLDMLLAMVRGAIQRVHEQAGPEGLSPSAVLVTKRLEELVAKILKSKAARAARDGQAAAQQERTSEPARAIGQMRTGRSSNDDKEPER